MCCVFQEGEGRRGERERREKGEKEEQRLKNAPIDFSVELFLLSSLALRSCFVSPFPVLETMLHARTTIATRGGGEVTQSTRNRRPLFSLFSCFRDKSCSKSDGCSEREKIQNFSVSPPAMASAFSLSRSSSCAAASTSGRQTPAVALRRPRLAGVPPLSSSRRRRRTSNDTAFVVVAARDGEDDGGKAPPSSSSSPGSPPLRRSGSDPMAEAAYEGWAVSSVGGGNGNGKGDDNDDGKTTKEKKKKTSSSSSVASEWGTQSLSNGQLVDALYEDDGSPELVAQNVLAVSLALLLAASLGGVLFRVGAVAVALVVAAVRYSVVAVLLLLVAVVLTPKR